ncbi:hypothetical protein MMC08_001329 [Hypocenomyce scalaris]|nr:hypothetical protein [Hypocenomyce scalaris]
MPSYAILNGTGKTGRCLLSILLESPQNTINVYVRSRSRLLALFPELPDNKKVTIFSGAIDDIALVSSCVSGVDAVFAVVATNENIPGNRIAQDQAQSRRRVLPPADPRSPDKTRAHPCPDHAFSNLYADLEHAERYLRLHHSWLNVVFVQPGGLVEDERKGHELSLERQKEFFSNPDLAAGMIELAHDGKYDWKGVSVIPTGKSKVEWWLPWYLVKGLLFHYVPPSHWIGQKLGLV